MPKNIVRQATLLTLLTLSVLLSVAVVPVHRVRALDQTWDFASGPTWFLLNGGSFQAPAGQTDGGGGQPNTVFGPNVRLSTDPPALIVVAQTEPTITISPVDGNNIVAGFHDPLNNGQDIACAFSTSFDGGSTYTRFGWVQPTVPGDQCSDPALSASFNGDFYYAYLSVRDGCFTNQLTGCTTDVAVAKSVDHGKTFSLPTPAARGTVDTTFLDKEYVAADSSSTSPFKGNVYVSYTQFDIVPGLAGAITGCQIMLARSTNGGLSYQTVQISPHFNCNTNGGPFGDVVQGSIPAVGPDGTVYVAYYDSTEDGFGPALGGVGVFTDMIARSTDGGQTFTKPTPIATLNELNRVLPPTSFRAWSSMFPVVKVGPDGTVYAVMATNPPGPDDSDIVLTKSSNGGKSWDPPARVNDDNTTNDQFFPWLAVQSDKTVHVIFGDRRNDPNDKLYDVYYTELSKGTGPFRNNIKVTDAQSDPARRNLTFIGDYFGLAASDTAVHPIWTDNRAVPSSRFPDIFTATGIAPTVGG